MKSHIFFTKVCRILFILFFQTILFQGCSEPESFSELASGPSLSEFSKTISAVEGDNVDLSIPDDTMETLGFKEGDELAVKWIYIGDDEVETEIPHKDLTLTLPTVKLTDSGSYAVTVEAEDKTLIFLFSLFVQEKNVTPEPPQPNPSLETYEGFFIEDGKKRLFIRTENITKEEALANCKKNAQSNPTRSIVCEWNGDEIFERIVTPKPKTPRGVYRGYFLIGAKKHMFIQTKNITKNQALSNCKINAKNNPSRSILCTWRNQEILKRIVKPKPQPVRGLYRGFFLNGSKRHMFIQTKNITKNQALSNCKTNAKNNPAKSILCTWRNQEILKRIVKPKPQPVRGLYQGFFLNGSKRHMFIQTKNITKNQALSNCKINAKNNPSRSILCTWRNQEILKRIVKPKPQPVRGLYRGFFLNGSKRHMFIQTKNITKNQALSNCKTNAKNNPTKSILCTWRNQEILKRIVKPKPQPVLGLYRGFFLNGSKRHMFIQTKNITKNQALSNCKTNAKNNPTKSILCTWKSQLIFKRVVKTPKLGTYRGYFLNGSSKRVFIVTKNISRENALANCKINARNNPSKGIMCTFNGSYIYRRNP